jgi:tyrosyl-tRNA synthetase
MRMKADFTGELKWRGLLQDIMPGTEELLNRETVTGYIGFDPTADSLHIGNLVQILTLLRFQRAGHKPIALIGGATGMVGDPSGKSAERNLLDEQTLKVNIDSQKKQLEKFLDFGDTANGAILVNNCDWMKDYSFLNFIRDVGKHLSVNYMMAKDSVKNRLETGMSFTEFSYQLLQAYDFYYLHKHYQCRIQMGGSDQWGNITSGTELIRRKGGAEAFGLTTQLVRKSDGSKFGKTESGNIWLDRKKTSPYKFYQFWINASDEDAANYIRMFTFLTQEEIKELTDQHAQQKEQRLLQKRLARELTVMVHSEEDLSSAVEASEILFRGGVDELAALDELTFSDVFEGVPQFSISKSDLEAGTSIIEFLTEKTTVFPSKSEAKKMILAGGVSVNRQKISSQDAIIGTSHLIRNKYVVIQKGKKNFYLCSVN